MSLLRLAGVASLFLFVDPAFATPPRDLPEEGDTEPPEIASARQAIEAHKPLAASAALSEMIADRRFPDRETELHYTLGLALQDLGMLHSAQRSFLAALRGGPDDPWFKLAFTRLVGIAAVTGDETDLARVAAKLPAGALRGTAGEHLAYLQGVHALQEGDLAEARARFEDVPESSADYARSQYLRGVVLTRVSRPRSALGAFANAEDGAGDTVADATANVRDLALLGMARVFYENQAFEKADHAYAAVPHDSAYWPDSVLERAWTNLLLQDPGVTLGQLLTLQSPYIAETEFLPEADVLRAITHYEVCEFPDVEAALAHFDDTYRPVHAELTAFLRQYSGDGGKALADTAWDRYFAPDSKPTELPKSLFARALRNRELAGLATHLQELDGEEALIQAQKRAWRDTVGDALLADLAKDRERMKRRAGLALLRELATTASSLGDLLTQVDILRFEMADDRVEAFSKAAANNGDTVVASRDEPLPTYAESSDRIYWPFNGEFWEDELGSYRYSVAGCRD